MSGYGQGLQGQGPIGRPIDQPGDAGYGGPGPQIQRGTQQQEAPGGGAGIGGVVAGPGGVGVGGGEWGDTGGFGYGPSAGEGTQGVEGAGQPPLGQRVKGASSSQLGMFVKPHSR